METLNLIGSIVVGLYFVFNGFNHFSQLNNMAGYAQSKGVPAVISHRTIIASGWIKFLF
jgi:uncharacterized membrane protein YphA (DoxX/SURF4 family)